MDTNNSETEVKISSLMKELQSNAITLESLIMQHLNRIDIINEEIITISKPFNESSDKIKKDIETLVFLLKKSIKTGSGDITYVKGAVRRNWNLDALDEICETDKYIKEKIWNLRKENEGTPQVRIKVELKGISTNDI
jgi:hypothetical protein